MSLAKPFSLALIIAAGCSTIWAQHAWGDSIEEMVVTGVRMDTPLHLTTDPKAARQPIPAQDGADYLKTIPGFSVIRKGGANGDPILRGMAGSRLGVLLDGEVILGGCNNRMDPPTAYISPDAFDSITVIKGPQSVQHGPGNSAGIVLFTHRPDPESGWHLQTSALSASHGRNDAVVDLSRVTPAFALRGIATHAAQRDYMDGDGATIHSHYSRWSSQLIIAWTPSERSRLELGVARSNGEAAYADRAVDGSRFERDNISLKLTTHNLTSAIQTLEASVYQNYVDHVMDNYSLRKPGGMAASPMAMNPDRETQGGRVAMTLDPGSTVSLILGLDGQQNKHRSRATMNQAMMPYQHKPRDNDARFVQIGSFAEVTWDMATGSRLIAGGRSDRWQVQDLRRQIALNMMMSVANPDFSGERRETLHSSFLRFERSPGNSAITLFAGIGHNERFPDYWEMIARESATSISAFAIAPEKTTQLDAGWIRRGARWRGSVSAFASQIDDYLMIESGYLKQSMAGTRATTIVRNIAARTWGVELDGEYRVNDHWRVDVTLASVRGANDTDDRTLPQLPPIEGRIGIHYDSNAWTAGLLWRAMAAQERVDVGRGNIVGQDFAPTSAANVLSINGGWRINEELRITAGIDNLLNTTYAEAISRAGVSITGFDQIDRVNEPGRTIWLRAQFSR